VIPPTHTRDTDANLALLAAATQAMKGGDREEAITQLKTILDSDPLHELANGMLGSIYADLGLTDKAVYAFRQVLTANPLNVLARFQMGLVLSTAHRHQEAIDAFQPMLDMKDDFLAHFHTALALVTLERPDQARPLLLTAKQRMPESHTLYDNLQQLLTATE
jgi:tetratricopeptide (TPR) repeat protein